MKNLKFILFILLTTTVGLRQATAQGKNNLKLYGKVLTDKKTNITVFQENNGDWTKIKTLKSKSRYCLELSPEENYYIVFIIVNLMLTVT